MTGNNKLFQTENSRTFLTCTKKVTPKKFAQCLIAGIATMSALSMGCCISWTSSGTSLLQDKTAHLQINDSEKAWIGSLLTLGAALGAISGGWLCSLFGRKKLLMIVSFPLYMSWLMIAYSGCIYGLYAARLLSGLVIGIICVAAPMYVSEIVHVNIRGALGTLFQVQVTIGALIGYILGGTIANFRSLALASSALPAIFIVCIPWIPETPVYLYSKGDVNAARKSLSKLRGENYNVEEELRIIAKDIEESKLNEVSVWDLVRNKPIRYGMIISLGLMVFQQLSGVNAAIFYANDIFAKSSDSLSPTMCTIIFGLVQVVATLFSTILIDKTGRKVLLMTSAFVMCICHIALGVFLQLPDKERSLLNVLPMISLGLYITMFSIGFGPIPWLMMGEIFSSKTKGLASSISVCFNWMLAFIVTNQFKNVTDHIGLGTTFILFGIICGVGALFVFSFVPETKGKNLDEVQEILEGKRTKNIV